MIPTLSQVCSLNSSFEDDLENYAAGRCTAVEVWFTKLESYLQTHEPDEVQRLCQQFEVNLPVASYQGGLLTSQGDARREAWDLFERRLGLCRQLGIGTVVVACDAAPPLAQQDIDRAVMSFQQIAESAAKREVRIAMEIQANAAFGNNLQTVAALVQSVGSPYLGVCLDLFHLWCGPSKLEDLQLLTPANLFHVQLCDLADKARELAADADRILPGDGDLPIAAVVRHLEAIGYTGHVSVELMNPMIWQIPAAQFGEVAMTALRKVLGQADMGGG